MATTSYIIPWQPCNFPETIISELNRRKTNRSFNYIYGEQGGWQSSVSGSGDWLKYKGPMSAWVRFCSNGKGRDSIKKPGFIFYGGKNFYSDYGFNNLEESPSTIGYVPDGYNTPHTIDNDLNTSNYPIHTPAPEIEKVNVTIQNQLVRKATIEWTCFSKSQLEYMTPYFLVPGISCIVEWGWNLYNPSSLLDLSNTSNLKNLLLNPYPLYINNILDSCGNYDVLFGIVKHFEWSIDKNKIKCKTEIMSKDSIYAGLFVNASVINSNQDSNPQTVTPSNSLVQFINMIITQLKAVTSGKDILQLPELAQFVAYVKSLHPDNWVEYLYGIFYGRSFKDKKDTLQIGANKKEDFDYNSANNEIWITMGMVMEILNFHSSQLKSVKGQEMFHVDIDDVVIGGHPNLISTDGSVCLIPNSEAPKYFYGTIGSQTTSSISTMSDYHQLQPSTNPVIPPMTGEQAVKNGKLADYRIQKICYQSNGIYRDDIDDIINRIRYENNTNSNRTFEFPFSYDRMVKAGLKPYPRRYSGYLKDIYVNVSHMQKILSSSDEVKTYVQFIDTLLIDVSNACGNFWDFRLVDGTGKDGLAADKTAPMKIVDYKFMSTINRGTIYTFDYFDADSLLMGVDFKPTLSNAQAIQVMFSSVNNPDRNNILTNGSNELLDYHFKDRLLEEDQSKNLVVTINDTSGYVEVLRELQQISPFEGSYQVTNTQNGKTIVRRLVLPSDEILQLLLDDGDEDNNPKYTGIMPGIQANFTIQGIGGLRTFMMFLVRNLPEPYSEKNVIFRIINMTETIEGGQWLTTITAGVIPLRGYIKTRLGITFGTNPNKKKKS